MDKPIVSDFFGIGAALEGAMEIYFRSARQSGRTTSLIDSLQPGDRVVFRNMQELIMFERKCKEREIKVDCIYVNPSNPLMSFNRGPSKGRTIFDHAWIEDFYRITLSRAQEEMATMAVQLSGYGEVHRKTRRKYQQIW
jgi:hypothetical protein